MASDDVLKELVKNGSNLVLGRTVSKSLIGELASIAQSSGAKLTISTQLDYDTLRELSAIYGNALTFVDSSESLKD